MTNATANKVPLFAALASLAAKQRVKLSIATKKLIPMEKIIARMVDQPQALISKKDAGNTFAISAGVPA